MSEVFQPPVTVLAMLLLSSAVEPGFPATAGYGAVAGLFVCVLPLVMVLVLVRLGKVTDHHVSTRSQRPLVLLMAVVSVLAGIAVLLAVGAPRSVLAAMLAVVAGVLMVAVISAFWKISGHAAAVSCAAVVVTVILGPAWLPLLLLIPAVGWARVVLRAHTVAQVVAGTLFGAVVMAGMWWLFLQWLL
ncbi:phosphatidic acid phosphatase [Pseudarthrobacter sp. J75]|uniref:phosphatase PAP2 family protein n=1 Tax=unclassified Pseudarthrobacter TaxID=2647000 RepID=UPI002E81C0F1|nr:MULTISPECIES: phosphatidic acid phosphatase [unclassified Pseudarthrobacter]MEE2523664.1 phosphatidic acid phosphatase [Pseudarthrobacter sp. J47]MEE2530055.1 phosphatidic acid phosphatase [Pseudarthrobacter sp. J75]MEE2570535.1 phosphatidic acid phosphatase [Pseudarthrobacter sp. J64]